MAGLRLSPERFSPFHRSANSGEVSEDKTIYDNLMEIFPLMEDFMNNQGSISRTSFAHQAPMTFTRAPSRQMPQKKRLDLKQLPTNGDDKTHRQEALRQFNSPLIEDLQRDLEELSNRLRETQVQSSSATKELESTLETKETQIVEMDLTIRRLQKEIQRKEQATFAAEKDSDDMKDEISRLVMVMERAETNIRENQSKANDFEQEILRVQLQLSTLFSEVDVNDRLLSESLQNVFRSLSTKLQSSAQNSHYRTQWLKTSSDEVEVARRAYLAAVVVARETNEESSLTLCSILRLRLQSLLRKTEIPAAGLAGPSMSGGIPSIYSYLETQQD